MLHFKTQSGVNWKKLVFGNPLIKTTSASKDVFRQNMTNIGQLSNFTLHNDSSRAKEKIEKSDHCVSSTLAFKWYGQTKLQAPLQLHSSASWQRLESVTLASLCDLIRNKRESGWWRVLKWPSFYWEKPAHRNWFRSPRYLKANDHYHNKRLPYRSKTAPLKQRSTETSSFLAITCAFTCGDDKLQKEE